MSHPTGCGSAFPTIPCNARIFLLNLEKSPQMVLKPSHSSCVTCFYFLSPCSVHSSPSVIFHGFHSHSLSADPGANVSEGGAGHQLGNCASNPEILYEMKAVYWLREIQLVWNVMEFGWPWNIFIILSWWMGIAAPSSLQWDLDFFSQLIYWQLKIWFIDKRK